ncbi:MAG TPA: class I SAM-dependent methyltransferase [Candidatus Polarisedimenticolia bacterium]|nr:class I SAM-dependent methyltransferase [Candidatus Polarisedimenticolia bacterium]
MSDSLYDSFIADYYDESPIVKGRLQDVAFYRNAVRDFGDPVLELGCGTGRITMALAEAGKRITGLDLSGRMLERAVKKRAALHVEARERVHFVQGDMARFDLGEKFRLVIIPFRPFQHLLEVRQQMDCLECVRKHLAPGGRLVLDVFQTDAERMHDPVHMREVPLTEYETADGRRVRIAERVAAFHRAEQRNDVEMIFSIKHRDGRQERLVFAWPLRYFFRYEVEHLLARCGFKVMALYGDFDRSPIRDDSPEMILVAEAK